MSENPYAPPQAVVEDMPAGQDGRTPLFFPVSTVKFMVLGVCTLSLYQYYWFYKNWKLVQARQKEAISPLGRTIFAIFYCYPLLKLIREAGDQPAAATLQAGALAAVWIVMTLLWRLPDPYWLVTYLSVLALLPVQVAVNAINKAAAPEHDPNSRFSGWNWFVVVFGGLTLLLAVYGTLYPQKAG